MEADRLLTIKENFLIVLDSRNATTLNNGSNNSDVYFEFDEPVRIHKDAIRCYCSVLSFSAPNSLYNINETNNLLSISFFSSSAYLSNNLFNYYIPYGNYNANTLLSELQKQISISTDIDRFLTISFNKITNKFTISDPGFSFIINDSSTIFEVMGFSKNTKYSSTSTSAPYKFEFPYTCNFNGINNLNIHLTNLNTQNIDSFNKSTSGIIQTIPINGGSNQIIYNKSNDFNFVINEDNIDYIHVHLLDDLENFLNFNNQHWNLTLYFTIIKDADRFSHHNSFFNILENGYS
jgi:hypothetical protein